MRKENSYNQLKEYFKEIAKQSNLINGFAGYFKHDLQMQLASSAGLKSPYLALWKYQKGYTGEQENTMATLQLGYVIIKSDVSYSDVEAQYLAIDECENIAKHVNSRLLYDSNNRKNLGHLLFGAFLKSRTQIVPIQLEELGFGVEVQVYFENPESLKLDPSEWKDIDKLC